MKLNQFLRTALVACAAVFTIGVGLSTQAPTVSASSATYKTVATTSIKKAPYHKKSSAGAIYNASHTKKVANLKTYPYTTWYATAKVTLKHGSSKALYYKVKNASGSVSGIVWNKYVTPGKSPFGLKYAKSAVALDVNTNNNVWTKNPNTARPIASLSKLMTLYLVRQKIAQGKGTWSSKVNTSNAGLKRLGKSNVFGGFKFNHNSYTVRQLYLAGLIESSNNAAIALGQWVAGGSTPAYNKKFIGMMNNQASEWHLKHSSFVSASGMEQNSLQPYGYSIGASKNANYVSASDIAQISRHFIVDYNDILTDASVKSMKVDGQTLHNYNNLLPGRKYYQKSLMVDGLKTGYTDPAGYCFVGTGRKSGHDRIVTVVLHDENEFTETRSLMNYVYNQNLA
ncbi:MAG: D-alanyl-D-alanine carboxypeptidase family protein [Lentilactobacillus parabuchneri]|uniref:D-alanyl-D-alanine carboxypeptidase family protein n=1 Tax=Lentilactobacillus parabuchneri TaxID=152331 RepID=UPI000A12179B|nr:serine hydrolase [Lentilactobacillus parabuchneri]ORN35063.1 D-alanyl-D-alanine carboxypeptidase DacA precursor [Lentilactobacillus parabuchneri]ORN35776.1 D-alanyl-D-alanine carboxypeptidase DacA precursor [Lentilactobacillus parabuchneri]ORN38614.1 D-alanyl-D-alanine carboxypeptidase DacA precursor [Lentilactobacillus parabuchneri]ORN40355.1 D-alanyl-D-alanine carboxypeptidase DacA precursor [Lentilactobacillus parabuchneri]